MLRLDEVMDATRTRRSMATARATSISIRVKPSGRAGLGGDA
jgi:hypothetical protein